MREGSIFSEVTANSIKTPKISKEERFFVTSSAILMVLKVGLSH